MNTLLSYMILDLSCGEPFVLPPSNSNPMKTFGMHPVVDYQFPIEVYGLREMISLSLPSLSKSDSETTLPTNDESVIEIKDVKYNYFLACIYQDRPITIGQALVLYWTGSDLSVYTIAQDRHL